MVRTKQTQHGSSLARPVGMQAAVHGDQPEADQPEAEQFEDLDIEADEEDWPDFDDPLKAAQQAAKASKSTGEAGEGSQDVDKLTSGAQAPANVIQDPTKNPLQPKPSTSKADTQAPTDGPSHAPTQAPTQDPTQAPTQDPTKTPTQDPTLDPAWDPEDVPDLTDYVKSYRQAAKVWFDTVQDSKEQAYDTLYDSLLRIGDPHIPRFSESNRKTVLDCIADKSGKFLKEDGFAVYIEQEEAEIKKTQVKLSGDAKEAIRDYYARCRQHSWKAPNLKIKYFS